MVGAGDGLVVGIFVVGLMVGFNVGLLVVGAFVVGFFVGLIVGKFVAIVGLIVGFNVGDFSYKY